MSWWAWMLVVAVVGTAAWGVTELVLVSRWLGRMRPTLHVYREKELRRWLKFHGGVR